MIDNNQYQALAELFKYPDSDFNNKILECQNVLNKHYPEQAEILQVFTDYVLPLDQDKKEELFTKTFDVQPICYLDLGYVIFGEDYKRGTFLMYMKEEQRAIGRDCSPELPDHLYHVLYLITIHPNKEFVDELVAKIIVPGVEKLIKEFDSAKVELKIQVIKRLHKALIQEELNIGNVYRNAFIALRDVMLIDFKEAIEAHCPIVEDTVRDSFFNKNNSVLVNK